MSEFKIGDRVRMTSLVAHGSLGEIVEIQESAKCSYRVALDEDPKLVLSFSADEFEPEDVIYEDADIMNEEIGGYISESTNGPIPRYRVGDVVTSSDDPDDLLYVISESTLVANGEYVYELTSAYGSGIPPIQSSESAITYHFHDKKLEKELITESYRHRSLPAWRGELYNFYVCYVDIDKHGKLDKATVGEYENHTIPPRRMEHILRSHSIYERIWDVVLNDGNSRWSSNREQIRKNLKIDDDELDDIAYSIRDKIHARNKNDLNPKNMERADKRNPDFTDLEYQFIDEIDKLDISKGQIKDHYPIQMTNLQIMDAIKEVYTSKELERIDGKQICDSKKEGADEDLDAPRLGKTHYKGHSDRYGIDIEFLYNFDYNFIETAYPLRMNKKPERHLRDRLDRK